ncbi:MAG: bacillithiol biosynthesis deacetylase BshB1 [Phycisphaerae bacterium]|nr:bacillithiol biosynthesis deacetylase BshB1 [Phycisphaerae bacterium]
MNVLVLAPHPDDAELGMGGSIARFIQQKHAVTIVDVTNGEPTPYGDEQTRIRETAAANEKLGGPARLNLGLPNRWLEATIPARVKVAEAIRQVRPDVMFVPYEHDAHPDHLAVHLLAQQARFTAKYTKTDMPGQPHWTPRLIYYFCTHLMLNIAPTFVIDISRQIEAKMSAVAAYQSQFYAGRGPQAGAVPEMVKTLCRYFGQRVGVEYAEPFFMQEVLGLAGIDAIL